MLKYDTIPNIKPSFAEKKIAQALDKRSIVYAQEVIFEKCINPDSGIHLRFDFYLPVQNILIEYDGVDFHKDTEVMRRDKIKTKFAKDNKVKLIRVQGIGNIETLFSRKKYGLHDLQVAEIKPPDKQNEVRRFSRQERITMCVNSLIELKNTSENDFIKKVQRMRKGERNIAWDVLKILRARGMYQN